jgi:hypothetical protein
MIFQKTILIVSVFASLSSIHALGQSGFDGMWNADPATAQFSGNPTTFTIRHGEYLCKSCVPAIAVKADGTIYSIAGEPYFDSVSVAIINDRTIERTAMKNGKMIARSTIKVSEGDRTADFEFMDARVSSSSPIVGRGTLVRVGKQKPHAGIHALSGSWMISRYIALSGNALSLSLKVEGGRIDLRSPTGQFYDAPLDGSEVPYHGDASVTSVSIVQLGTYTLMETQKRDGKPIRSRRLMVDVANPSSMHIIDTDVSSGQTIVYTVNREDSPAKKEEPL